MEYVFIYLLAIFPLNSKMSIHVFCPIFIFFFLFYKMF